MLLVLWDLKFCAHYVFMILVIYINFNSSFFSQVHISLRLLSIYSFDLH